MSSPRRLKVLVVEDEGLVRLDLVEALGRLGFDTLEAPSADAALSILAATSPDALFTDISMPGTLNGLQLAHHAREQLPTAFIAIISGNKRPDDLPAGAQYMWKPWTDDDFQGLVGHLNKWCEEQGRA